jgi:chemotaxis protein methyltransferase CheR
MSQAHRRIELPDDQVFIDRLKEKDYARIARLVSNHTGIKLPPSKRTMVEGRLRKRMRVLGHAGFAEYSRYLFEQGGIDSEFVHLIDAVTTNKTDFFREVEHFTALEQDIVPALISMRRPGERVSIKLWSAASSTGAEAYTIAMVMAELAARLGEMNFEVLGTDISTEVLEQAKLAIYPSEMVTPVPAAIRERYVMHGRTLDRQGEVRIVPELRRRVRFCRLNLMDAKYPFDHDMDVIFLRNVLIYFDKPTQEAVVGRLLGHLRPGGFLFLGHSESVVGSSLKLRQWAPSVFQRV